VNSIERMLSVLGGNISLRRIFSAPVSVLLFAWVLSQEKSILVGSEAAFCESVVGGGGGVLKVLLG